MLGRNLPLKESKAFSVSLPQSETLKFSAQQTVFQRDNERYPVPSGAHLHE